jgi:hypothetical protein
MSDKPEQAQHAHVGDLQLDTWIVDERYFWYVKDITRSMWTSTRARLLPSTEPRPMRRRLLAFGKR